MTFAYSLICWEIWRVMEKRSVMTSRKALSRNYTSDSKIEENIQLNNLDNNVHCLRNDNNQKRVKLIQFDMNNKFNEKNKNREDSKIVKQVIYMLVTVVVLFTICWAPLLFENVLTAYGILPKQRIGQLKHISISFHLMAYFNR